MQQCSLMDPFRVDRTTAMLVDRWQDAEAAREPQNRISVLPNREETIACGREM